MGILSRMPGGSRFRQWYAARARLRAQGRWEGDTAEDPGAPRPQKRPRRHSPERGQEAEQEEKQVQDPAPASELHFLLLLILYCFR